MHGDIIVLTKNEEEKCKFDEDEIFGLLQGFDIDYVREETEEDQQFAIEEFLEYLQKEWGFEVDFSNKSFTFDMDKFSSKTKNFYVLNGMTWFHKEMYRFPIVLMADAYKSAFSWIFQEAFYLEHFAKKKTETIYVTKAFDFHY
ncbi:hypothetical protein [uncultured Pediococcus sp.]|uniref:hypothetical protein n=1 Tax=uncultured Pediococcus sp. TaxID=165192 RepID=UPI00259B4E9E|nr:hypothetical protein [uncultured Pediococcus sp.]